MFIPRFAPSVKLVSFIQLHFLIRWLRRNFIFRCSLHSLEAAGGHASSLFSCLEEPAIAGPPAASKRLQASLNEIGAAEVASIFQPTITLQTPNTCHQTPSHHPSCNFNYIPHHPPRELFSFHFFLFFLLFCDLSSRFFCFWAHSQHHPSAPAAGCVGWHHRKRTPGKGLLMQSDYFSQQPAGACNVATHPPIYLDTASPDKLYRKDITWSPLLKFIANYSRGPGAGARKKKPAENHPGQMIKV